MGPKEDVKPATQATSGHRVEFDAKEADRIYDEWRERIRLSEQSIEEARLEGLRKGMQEGLMEVAEKFLQQRKPEIKLVDIIDKIADITGLSEEQVILTDLKRRQKTEGLQRYPNTFSFEDSAKAIASSREKGRLDYSSFLYEEWMDGYQEGVVNTKSGRVGCHEANLRGILKANLEITTRMLIGGCAQSLVAKIIGFSEELILTIGNKLNQEFPGLEKTDYKEDEVFAEVIAEFSEQALLDLVSTNLCASQASEPIGKLIAMLEMTAKLLLLQQKSRSEIAVITGVTDEQISQLEQWMFSGLTEEQRKSLRLKKADIG